MTARLTQYGNALSAAEAALASLAAMWEGRQPVDGEALKARTEALSARAEALLRQEKEADARLSHNSRLLPQLEKAVREAGEKLEDFGVLDDLYAQHRAMCAEPGRSRWKTTCCNTIFAA